MARVVAIGKQRFDALRTGNFFLVDKTSFICDWWNGGDDVTLICRPRRFGKTLTLSMVECFLSTRYAGRGEELFGGLHVWGNEAMRALQGTVPVVMASFADCKGVDLAESVAGMKQVLCAAVGAHDYLLESSAVREADRAFLARVSDDMDDLTAKVCLKRLCSALYAHWGTKPVVLLDEYDTPMQEAWLANYWDGMASFVRGLFNSTFKTNPDLGRALVTGVTRVASESIFSDMNNPRVVSTLANRYATALGFTEEEVEAALAEFGMAERMADVRDWYDGFTFGEAGGIYNPWSITGFLDEGRLDSYWANSSSDGLVSSLVRRGDEALKADFETLLDGGTIVKSLDERVHFRRLGADSNAVWSLLLAAGYLHVACRLSNHMPWELELGLTNREVGSAFEAMVSGWFAPERVSYNAFVRALLACDAEAMCDYLADVAQGVMSSFDSGRRPSRSQPERFWHGLILGLVVDLRGRYEVRSQPESGYGRCDVLLCPLDGPAGADPAFVLEFKVVNRRRGEHALEDALASALAQVAEREYDAILVGRGIAKKRIHHFGIVFQGKDVLVG